MKTVRNKIFWSCSISIIITILIIANLPRIITPKVNEIEKITPISLVSKDSNVVYFESTHEEEFKIPVVEFNINGVLACFIIDTGSNGSILDYKWYKENSGLFTFKKATYIDYIGVSGVSTIRTVYVDGVVNGIKTNFTTSDLTAIIKTLKNHNLDVVGILGSVYLEQNNYIIDYNTKSIYRKFN